MQIDRETTDLLRVLLHDTGTNKFCMLLIGIFENARVGLVNELVNLDPTIIDFSIYYAIIQARLETLDTIIRVLVTQLPAAASTSNVIQLQ